VAKVVGVTSNLTTTVLGSGALLAVVPASLLNTAGSLNIIVSNPAPGGDSTPLTLSVGNAPVIGGVVNAASLQVGSFSPGAMITFFGQDIGPSSPLTLADADNNGYVDTTLGTLSVTIDGTAAPIIYASQHQITAQVPYEAAIGGAGAVTIDKGSGTPATTTIAVAATAPGIFSLDGTGSGQAAALNFSTATGLYSVNTSSNAAKIGDTVLLYLTGEGDYATAISPRTGYLYPGGLATLPQVSPLPSVTIGGVAATVNYAGPSIGSVLGLLQINVVVPAGSSTGAAVPVAVSIGGVAAQSGITLAVKP
jgi:uncharacterized protein (TIGR03437 family)